MNLKNLFRSLLLVIVVAGIACAPKERTIILLSTNDMHANIDRFPQLASVVKKYRETEELVLLVDAGDIWTGNAFVDRAIERGLPMVELMNRLGYDAGTLGNHEFDFGQAVLAQNIKSMNLRLICANLISDTDNFPQLPPYTIIERGGLRIGFVGVLSNYEGDKRPAGKAESFEGLIFRDPQFVARKYAEQLRPQCDVLVLLSHMGDKRDREFLEKWGSLYDVIIGGHSHNEINTRINGTLLTQTGAKLENVGVTTITTKRGKFESSEFFNVPLKGVSPDKAFQDQVESILDATPELREVVGSLSLTAYKIGLANWMAKRCGDVAVADIGMYHIGGVRSDSISAGNVRKGYIYNLEPFETKLARMKMTPENLRRLIIAKYNDPINTKEARRIDLVLTTPYDIIQNRDSLALDVRFHQLQEGRLYTIGFNEYIFKNYRHYVNFRDDYLIDTLITDLLIGDLRKNSPLHPDNIALQTISYEVISD